jgi:hypothetical protein
MSLRTGDGERIILQCALLQIQRNGWGGDFFLELVFARRKFPNVRCLQSTGCEIREYKRAPARPRNHNHTNSSASNMKTIFVSCAVVLLVAIAQAHPLEAEQQLLLQQEAQLSPG